MIDRADDVTDISCMLQLKVIEELKKMEGEADIRKELASLGVTG